MHILEVTNQELAALLDALNKGASRHESYAKFHKTSARSAEQHEVMAGVMRDLHRDLSKKRKG